MKKVILLSLFFALIIISWPVVTQAQEFSLGIAPPLLDIVMKPNKSLMIAYKIDNYGDPVITKAKVLPFEPYGNKGNIKISPEFSGPVRFSLDNSNLELGKSFFMKTGESKQLLLRMRLPQGAPEGDYYYTLLIETEPPPSQGVSSGRARGSIGSNILITVTESGRTELKGKIALFDLISRFRPFGWRIFDSNAKIPVVLNIENAGKNKLQAEGEITLLGGLGMKTVYQIPPQNILAQSQRMVFASPSADLEKPASLILSGFFLGKHTLRATINIGEGLNPINASVSFVAIPFRFLVGLALAILMAYLLVKRLSRDKEADEA